MNISKALKIVEQSPDWQMVDSVYDAGLMSQYADFREAKEVLGSPSNYTFVNSREAASVAQQIYNYFLAKPWIQNANILGTMLINIAVQIPNSLQDIQRQILFDGKYNWRLREKIFISADTIVRDALIAHIEANTLPPQLNDRSILFQTLAWIDDPTVTEVIRNWKLLKSQVFWEGYFDRCLQNAGWEVTRKGVRRELIFPEKWEMVPQKEKDMFTRFISGDPLTETCQWCHHSLIALFQFDLHNSEFSLLPIEGEKLTVPICPYCTVQNLPQYYKIDTQGNVKWSDFTPDTPDQRWRHEEDDLTQIVAKQYRLQKIKRLYPTYDEENVLGGHPNWYSESEYPECPQCKHTMKFLAQHRQTNQEGMFYTCICFECMLVATRFQTI